MFGLGLIEIAIVFGLGYLAVKHIIARRFPGIYRALNIVFLLAIALMLVFGILTRVHAGPPA